MKFKIIVSALSLLFVTICYSDNKNTDTQNYLKKPTGSYKVGFQDFYWVNQNSCPDINFNGKNSEDFSPNNINHCREIITRIYYPTAIQEPYAPYYLPIVKSLIEQIQQQDPKTPEAKLKILKNLQSYSIHNAKIVKDQLFPVLFFIPGSGWPAEIYENSITELVSQGYIVIGISSPFINLVELQNGHVIDPEKLPPKSAKEMDALAPLQKNDISFIYDLIHKKHDSNDVFAGMDLNHIGIFGHSLGGRVLADLSHEQPTWFQAGATLDIGTDITAKSRNKFTIPFMHEICSNRKTISPFLPVIFELGDQGYLVVISPKEQDYTYSYHANFADYSTLQYIPAFKAFLDNIKEQNIKEKLDVKILSHSPSQQDQNQYIKTTYIFFKTGDGWHGSVYTNKIKLTDFDLNLITGLRADLDNLPDIKPEKLSALDIQPIEKNIVLLNEIITAPLGYGNGWEITNAVNTYLITFFNAYLKNIETEALKKCTPLYNNTFIKCGPGRF